MKRIVNKQQTGSWNGCRIPTVCRPRFRIFPRNISHRLSDPIGTVPNSQLPIIQAFPTSSASLFANYVIRAEEAEAIETRLRLQEKKQVDEALVRYVVEMQQKPFLHFLLRSLSSRPSTHSLLLPSPSLQTEL